MLRHVTLVRTDVSEELSASFIRVTRIGELGTTLAVTSNRHTLRRNTSNIPEDAILHSHRRENLKSLTVRSDYPRNAGSIKMVADSHACGYLTRKRTVHTHRIQRTLPAEFIFNPSSITGHRAQLINHMTGWLPWKGPSCVLLTSVGENKNF
jgi:hypothetical protein